MSLMINGRLIPEYKGANQLNFKPLVWLKMDLRPLVGKKDYYLELEALNRWEDCCLGLTLQETAEELSQVTHSEEEKEDLDRLMQEEEEDWIEDFNQSFHSWKDGEFRKDW